MDKKKEDVLRILEQALGVVTTACRQAQISRDTFYRWKKEDEDFARKVAEIEDVALDFAESQLHMRMKDGSDSAIIFYMKTKGRKRGYAERTEITGVDGSNINIALEVVRNEDKPQD